MRYFLWGSIQDTSEQSLLPIAPQSLQCSYCPLNCRPLANPFQPNPNANTGLTPRPEFPFLHHLHNRVPFRNTLPTLTPHNPDLKLCFPAIPPLFHLSTFLILPIHFSSCGNSFFHLTLHFPSRYLYIVRDVHSQNANLAFSAPNQGDSCPLNCAIFSLSPTTNSKT